MRITQESDYALRIMCALARRGCITDAKTIADETAVPLRFALKILRKLLGGNLLTSQKGVNGGYLISGTPETITIRRVIELIDGPITICRCVLNEEACNRSGEAKDDCMLHHVFSAISLRIADMLDRITIAQLISDEIGTEDINRLLKG